MNNLKYQKPEAQDQESLFSMLNPVALAKYQYASPWALMTYNTARTTGKFGWNPLLFEFGNRNANTIGGKVGAALGGRYTSYEPDTNLANLFKKSGISKNSKIKLVFNY